MTDEIEQKIIALYGLGMSYNDIAAHLKEIYGLEISNGTLSAVTDKIIHTVKEWQVRQVLNYHNLISLAKGSETLCLVIALKHLRNCWLSFQASAMLIQVNC